MAVTITSFTAGSSSISIGSSTTITPVFSGGVGCILIGVTGSRQVQQTLPVSSGEVISITPTISTTYVLTVTDPDGSGTLTASLPITVVIPTARKLSVTTGSGVVDSGSSTYFCNGPVFSINVSVDPASLANNIAQVNESTIRYQIIFNNNLADGPIYIVGITNLNLVLATFGLTWS